MKSYTDILQSRVLAKFLPLESADMGWYYSRNPQAARNQMWAGTRAENADIPCWSLAALLGVLEHPRCFQGDKPTYWFCGCFGKDELYHEVEADNPIDACVKMIICLNKLKLL